MGFDWDIPTVWDISGDCPVVWDISGIVLWYGISVGLSCGMGYLWDIPVADKIILYINCKY